ncbi:MAG: hypothetical protein J5J00_11090 [Deltaproteobacteria bacterium]|nr:hypothetical protein [Deltaproteobacteria bacterium]
MFTLQAAGSVIVLTGVISAYKAISHDVGGIPAAPLKGALTFSSEGSSDPDSRFFSRKAHLPSQTSGVTIGRGYDMKHRSPSSIRRELLAAGLDRSSAELLSRASGLSGERASSFIRSHPLPILSADQERRLFEITYNQIESDTRRLIKAHGLSGKYFDTELHERIRSVLIDLRYRGDLTPTSKKILIRAVANNDLSSFTALLSERRNWPGVPIDRFNRRADYLRSGAVR